MLDADMISRCALYAVKLLISHQADVGSLWQPRSSSNPLLKTMAKELLADTESLWELKAAWSLPEVAALSLDPESFSALTGGMTAAQREQALVRDGPAAHCQYQTGCTSLTQLIL